jgi:hypothetical protein
MRVFERHYIELIDSHIYFMGTGSQIRIIPGIEIWYRGKWNYGIELSWLFYRLKIQKEDDLPF